jgi:hypothetical protein
MLEELGSSFSNRLQSTEEGLKTEVESRFPLSRGELSAALELKLDLERFTNFGSTLSEASSYEEFKARFNRFFKLR